MDPSRVNISRVGVNWLIWQDRRNDLFQSSCFDSFMPWKPP